jgi:hypothetical protein
MMMLKKNLILKLKNYIQSCLMNQKKKKKNWKFKFFFLIFFLKNSDYKKES